MRIGLATALKAVNAPDNVIQMICRWTNPESLRAYARHGQSLHINLVDQAEKAVIDAVQAANVPIVCASEGNAALHVAFGGTMSARARAVLNAVDDAGDAADDNEDANATPDLSPLTVANCVARRVLVARAAWPQQHYKCDEHGGRGWTARIVECRHDGAATVHFLHATTSRGLPYEDVQLQLASLSPL
jgi:hypothetical protein